MRTTILERNAVFTRNRATSLWGRVMLSAATSTLTVAALSLAACGVATDDDDGAESSNSQLLSAGEYTLFDDTSKPAVASDPDTNAVEVGVRFKADVDGQIAGIRFYKGARNVGRHDAHLWASDGTLLTTSTFARESRSGWQTVRFTSPVTVRAGQFYVASYHTEAGRYAGDNGYFEGRSVDNGPLHAPADTASGRNGVYRYGATAFPNQSFAATNYWVDVIFKVGTTTPPTSSLPPATPPAPTTPAPTTPPTPTTPPAPTVPPAPATPQGTDFCATFPSLPSEKPTAANTGVPAGTVLTPGAGMTITTPGTVINARDITGTITVRANNVTIQNSKVHLPGGENDRAIVVADGVTGTKILHSEIYSDRGAYIGVFAYNTTVCGCYLHGWENALTVGGGTTIQANYIDRLQGGYSGSHHDGIEVYGGGAPTRIWGNNVRLTDLSDKWRGETGAINITAWYENIDDVELNGNWLGGGGYTLYVDEQGGYQVKTVRVTNTRFYRNSGAYGTQLIRDASSVTAWSGNVFDDNGATVAK